MKPRTLFDKIWDYHLINTQEDGASLIYIDRHLVHEVTSPQAFEGLRMSGRTVNSPNRTLAVADHNVPTTDRASGIDEEESRIQVEALDSNNCALTSDSIHISIISDYVNLINANGNEDYIDDVYVLCSADSSVNIDISPFITGDYSVEWREIMGTHSILLSENPSIEIITNQSTAYTLNVSSCSFDFFINYRISKCF